VSAGCDNCYAIREAHRHDHEGGPYEGLTVVRNDRVDWNSKVMLVEKDLLKPIFWQKPRKIFVASMSDPFHHNVPDEYLDRMFAVMALSPQHVFQLLTKRPERMLEYFADIGGTTRANWIRVAMSRIMSSIGKADKGYSKWPLPNVWIGVSVEDQATADERIPLLLKAQAAVCWISAEPLLGPIKLFGETYDWTENGPDTKKACVNWCVIGGESGPGARSMELEWANELIQQCDQSGVAVFMKQLGAKPIGPAELPWPITNRKGDIMEDWPQALRVREWPEGVTA
jgi:protein gp37